MSSAAEVADALAAIVADALAASPSVPGIVVAIDTPNEGTVAVAGGVADPATGEPLTGDHAVRIASCTKPFVAGTVLQLAGDGHLSLDQPVVELLATDVAELLRRFGPAPEVTVRHLLQHRSGLVDHTLFPEFVAPTSRQWTAQEQIAIAVDKAPLFEPDAAFSYSDTGYVLLGQLVEHLTDLPLATAVRRLLHLDRAQLPSIHWEQVEPTPHGLRRAHQFHHGVDTFDWNPSLDLFGGGGIVATMPDMARWWTDLFAGHVHQHLRVQLADPRPTIGPDGEPWPNHDGVGLGVFHRVVDGHDVWAHGGYWGLQTLHVPSIGASAALVILQRADDVPGPSVLADATVRALLAAS